MIRTLFPPPTFDGLPPDATHGHSQFTSSKKPSVDSQHFNLLLPHTEIPLTLSTVVLPATSGHRFYFGNVSHSLPALLFCATLLVLLSVPSPALPCPRPLPLFSVRALSRSSLSAPSPTLPCPHLPLHLPVTFPCTSLSPSPAPPCHLPLHLPVTFPLLISDVVRLSGTYLILLIRIRLYLCRLDYILSMFLLYLPFSMFLLFSLGTFCLFPNGLLSCITIDGLDLVSRTFCRVQ